MVTIFACALAGGLAGFFLTPSDIKEGFFAAKNYGQGRMAAIGGTIGLLVGIFLF